MSIVDQLEKASDLACRFLIAYENTISRHWRDPTARETAFKSQPDEFKAWVGFEFIGLAAMTIFARSAEARAVAQGRDELRDWLAKLAPHHEIARYLLEMLECVDAKFVILVPHENVGFHIEADAVRNNFHLMTLLQARLIGDGYVYGPEVDEGLAAMARGQADLDEADTISAAFNFHPWIAVEADGQISPEAMIFGEQHPNQIPDLDDEKIMILTPVTVVRSWDTNWVAPLHEALRSDVRVIDILVAPEVKNWLRRCAQAPP